MEISSAHTLCHAKLSSPSKSFSSYNPYLLHSKSLVISFQSSKSILTNLKAVKFISTHKKKNVGEVLASSSADQDPPTTADIVSDRWILEPVGDGDSRHLSLSVELPKAFEIASDEVTVGRLPDEADVVIPIATVSGLHARIQKKEGNLLVTDLDSTNGTFIDDKRLKPGVVASVSSGSCITFGDTHLAMFRVSQLKTNGNQEGSEAETDDSSDNNTVKA